MSEAVLSHLQRSESLQRWVADRFKIAPNDAVLICYANNIEAESAVPLKALKDLIARYNMGKALPIVHLLPFYPWDTDRGFSVIDYYEVHEDYGDWNDIRQLSEDIRLMFDFVANHASFRNPLVQGALIERHLAEDDPRYSDYSYYKDFVTAFSDHDKPSDEDLSQLLRPRPNPALTRYSVFEDQNGELCAMLGVPAEGKVVGDGWVWTTFSRAQLPDGTEDTCQVDLNFQNPALLLETLKILLFYCEQGASIIRLDAIGYIWKKLGSQSLHEPEAHRVLELIKDFMTLAEPNVITIAEVNEPQDKAFGYLGSEGHEESDLIYQFTHFPLAVHAIHRETAQHYMNWLTTLEPAKGRQFITVLGSHDGMGLKPVRGILPDEEIQFLQDKLIDEFKALPNMAKLAGGQEIVYEICATPWNLVNRADTDEPLELQLDRYLAIVALSTLVRGMPAIYINGLIGSENYLPPEGLDENRAVNREVFDYDKLCSELDDTDNRMRIVLDRVSEILKFRAETLAFDPAGPPAEPLEINNDKVVAAKLSSPHGSETYNVLVNISATEQNLTVNDQEIVLNPYEYQFQKCSG